MEEVLGKCNSEFLEAVFRLGNCLKEQQNFEEAEMWYRKVLSDELDTLGEEEKKSILDTMDSLAMV